MASLFEQEYPKSITQTLFENEQPVTKLGFDYAVYILNKRFVVVTEPNLEYVNTFKTLENAINAMMVCKPVEEVTVLMENDK